MTKKEAINMQNELKLNVQNIKNTLQESEKNNSNIQQVLKFEKILRIICKVSCLIILGKAISSGLIFLGLICVFLFVTSEVTYKIIVKKTKNSLDNDYYEKRHIINSLEQKIKALDLYIDLENGKTISKEEFNTILISLQKILSEQEYTSVVNKLKNAYFLENKEESSFTSREIYLTNVELLIETLEELKKCVPKEKITAVDNYLKVVQGFKNITIYDDEYGAAITMIEYAIKEVQDALSEIEFQKSQKKTIF